MRSLPSSPAIPEEMASRYRPHIQIHIPTLVQKHARGKSHACTVQISKPKGGHNWADCYSNLRATPISSATSAPRIPHGGSRAARQQHSFLFSSNPPTLHMHPASWILQAHNQSAFTAHLLAKFDCILFVEDNRASVSQRELAARARANPISDFRIVLLRRRKAPIGTVRPATEPI